MIRTHKPEGLPCGIYIVRLTNELPKAISTGSTVKVNRDNLKVGLFKNSSLQRYVNYYVTFRGCAEMDVIYETISEDEVKALEKAILKELKKYRIPGKKGAITEWLEGISYDEVHNIIVNTINTLED